MAETKIYQALADAFVAEGVDTLFVLTGDGNMHWEAALSARDGFSDAITSATNIPPARWPPPMRSPAARSAWPR